MAGVYLLREKIFVEKLSILFGCILIFSTN